MANLERLPNGFGAATKHIPNQPSLGQKMHSEIMQFSENFLLKLLVTWTSCLAASVPAAIAIQAGANPAITVYLATFLVIGCFVAVLVLRTAKVKSIEPSIEHHDIDTGTDGARRLRAFLEEVKDTVPPYPSIDVRVEPLFGYTTPKREVFSYVFAGLLVGLALYGITTHDREILLAVLDVVKYSVVALSAWALGQMVYRLAVRHRN